MAQRLGGGASVFPARDVAEILVVAPHIARADFSTLHLGIFFRVLEFLAEMSAAAFAAFERVETRQFAEFQEVGDASGFFERDIQRIAAAGDVHIFPKLRAQSRDACAANR